MRRGFLIRLFIAALSLSGTSAVAQITTWTWDNGGGTTNWSTATNWNPDVVPPNNGLADVVLEGVGGFSVVDLPWSINSLRFGNTAESFSLFGDGNTLTIGGGGLSSTNPGNVVNQVESDVQLAASQTWSTDAGLVFGVGQHQSRTAHFNDQLHFDWPR